MKTIPVHVISGFLGAGKTTMLREELKRRMGQERCALVVNDFGEARVDATILGDHAVVREIPGGCVCCTAPENLVESLADLLANQQPDRIFIECTGLARPADVVDTVLRSGLNALELRSTVVVVDPERFADSPPPILMEQLAAADVVVANRVDCSSSESIELIRKWCEERYPPLAGFHCVERGSLEPDALEVHRGNGFRIVRPVDSLSTEGWVAQSRLWSLQHTFSMQAVKRALSCGSLERVKGLFRTDIGWFEIQRAGGAVESRPTSIRTGSRVDGIAQEEESLGVLFRRLESALVVESSPRADKEIQLVDLMGRSLRLSRQRLQELPSQVADVSEEVPGREGSGVRLSEVLALVENAPNAVFVLVASDGMTSAPVPIAEVGGAILVHSLDGEPYPSKKGGPFRVFVPRDEAVSGCANVKKLVRIVLESP